MVNHKDFPVTKYQKDVQRNVVNFLGNWKVIFHLLKVIMWWKNLLPNNANSAKGYVQGKSSTKKRN